MKIATTSLATVALLAGTSAYSAPIYEESFDYAAGNLSDAAEWTGSASVVSPGLTYGNLATSGNTASVDNTNGRDTVDFSGFLDDGDTLWFSVLLNVKFGTNEGFGFALGTDNLNDNNGTTMSGSGNGFGIRGKGSFKAGYWENGGSNESGVGGGSSLTTALVVGEMIFNADSAQDDTINIYLPDTDLNLGSVVSSISATLDQTTFDTVGFAAKGSTSGDSVDEIRFGATYEDVSPIPEPGSLALMGLGGLMMIKRRRRG